MSPQAPLPLRLRHLIFQFGRMVNAYVLKNKNKNKKLFRTNIKLFLNYSQTACIGRFKHVKTRYFFAFCLLEEVSLVVNGDRVIDRGMYSDRVIDRGM